MASTGNGAVFLWRVLSAAMQAVSKEIQRMHPQSLMEYRIYKKCLRICLPTTSPKKGKTPDPIQDKGFYWLRE